MTDGGSIDDRAEDMADDDLLVALGQVLQATETVPPEVLETAKASFIWREIDAELAALTFDSIIESPELAGVRGSGGPRSLTFEYENVIVDVEIDDDASGRTVIGHVAPATVEWVEVHQASVPEPLRLQADDRGRFRATGVGPGSFRLLCRFGAGAPFPMLMTDWVSI
jgi:hypothetical protein